MVVVDVVSDGVHRGPRRVLEESLGECLERGLVHLVDLVHVFLSDVAVQVNHEGFDGVGYEIRVVPEGIRGGCWWCSRRVGWCVVVIEVRHFWVSKVFETERRGRESEKRDRLGFMRYCGGEREKERNGSIVI